MVTQNQAGQLAGPVEARSGFTVVDHTEVRIAPERARSQWAAGPVWALWAEPFLTHASRVAAQSAAQEAGATIVELVPVPTGEETSRVANAPVRVALAETTRRTVDQLIVVPAPALPWNEGGVAMRAQIAAAYGATELLALASQLTQAQPEATPIPVRAIEVPSGQADMPQELLDAWVIDGQPLPLWMAEPEVAELLRAVHRPPTRTGLTVLLSGLSGSGKSTVARALSVRLVASETRSVSLLDGDVVRHHLSKGLGFSRPDRITNVMRIGFVASEITKAGGIAVCCPIAPYDQTRKDVRAMVQKHGAFVLVHVATPLAECERRDRKGLYAKARRGEIPEFTGISDPYEEPTDADVVIDTTGRTIDDCVDEVYTALLALGVVAQH
jgi:sulfate adenylyltransferase